MAVFHKRQNFGLNVRVFIIFFLFRKIKIIDIFINDFIVTFKSLFTLESVKYQYNWLLIVFY